jgi:hypothetical protein
VTLKDLSVEDIRNLMKVLGRQPEAMKVFYYHPTNPLGQPQHGGYSYVFTREEVCDESKRREAV